MRHRDVLELDAGHVFVDAVEERQERVVVLLLVVVAFDLVEPELDVGDFAGDGVDGGERPAGEVRHRLCGVDGLRAGGLVDGERVARRCVLGFRSTSGISALRVPRRSRRTTAPLP